jgi:hypothetical protein
MNRIDKKFFATLLVSFVFFNGYKNLAQNMQNSQLDNQSVTKHNSEPTQSGLEILSNVQVSLSLTNSQISLHEPIILDFVVQNDLAKTIELNLGEDRKEAFLFVLVYPDGKRVTLPQLRSDGIFRRGEVSIQARQIYTQKLLLNQWIQFKSPGKYILEGGLANPIKSESGRIIPVNSAFSLTLDIKPRNSEHLKEVSALLVRRIEESSTYGEAAETALALSYINDPVVVTDLQKVLTLDKMVEPILIKGLERICSKESVQVLIDTIYGKPLSEDALLAKSALETMNSQCSSLEVKQMIRQVMQSK